MYTETPHKSIAKRYLADPYDILQGAPLIVLIDKYSASGSEIVAGSLQYHNRAIVMGTISFGKGSIQAVYPYKDKLGGAIKLTIAHYKLPSGQVISKTNRVKPDIIIDPLTNPKQNLELFFLHQTNIDGKNMTFSSLANKDRLVYDATKLLKGLHAINT